jgi:hypothetical protein
MEGRTEVAPDWLPALDGVDEPSDPADAIDDAPGYFGSDLIAEQLYQLITELSDE